MIVLEKNKSIVLEAFDTLFNKRDYAAAERFWSPKYISLVPAYLSATLHAPDSLIGAGAFLATQISSVFASIYFGNVHPERNGVVGPLVVVIGLVLLVTGTQQNLWTVIMIATILVGAGSGIASGAAYVITARVGQGHEHAPFPAYSSLRTPATACRP